jgi:hypothetical protein
MSTLDPAQTRSLRKCCCSRVWSVSAHIILAKN